MNLGKLSLKKNDHNIEKEYDKRNRMDMSDNKECYERGQTDRYDGERVTNYIEFLKLVIWFAEKYRQH